MRTVDVSNVLLIYMKIMLDHFLFIFEMLDQNLVFKYVDLFYIVIKMHITNIR